MSLPEELVAATASGRNGLALALTKDRIYVSINYLVQIISDGVPYLAIGLSGAGRRVVSDTGYRPLLLGVADMVCDSGANSTLTFTVAADRNMAVYVGSTWVHYNTLHEVLAAYPVIGSGARCKVWQEVASDDGYNVATYYLAYSGNVRQVTAITPGSVTFIAESTDVFELTPCPLLTVNDTMYPVGPSEPVLPKTSLGQVVPINLGGFTPPLIGMLSFPEAEGFGNGEWLLRAIGVFGLKLPLQQTIPWYTRQRADGTVLDNGFMLSAAGRQGDGTLFDGANTSAYVDLGSGVVGRIYSDWPWGDDAPHGGSLRQYTPTSSPASVSIPRFPWMQVPVPCSPHSDGSVAQNARLEEWGKACDGNPYTYATLEPGETATFRVGSVGDHGMISLNTTDDGDGYGDYAGPDAPVGLSACALLVNPATGDTPIWDQVVQLMFCFPDGTQWPRGSGAWVATPPPLPGAMPKLLKRNLEVTLTGETPGTNTSGWLGTKFHNWDFTTNPGAGDTDPIGSGHPTTPGTSDPFEIVISNVTPGRVCVSSVVLLVGCRCNVGSFVPINNRIYGWDFGAKIGEDGTVTGTAWDPAKKVSWKKQHAGGALLAFGAKVGGWESDQYAPSKSRSVIMSTSPNSTIKMLVNRPSYFDDASGTCTGTPNAKITDPIHHAMWLLLHNTKEKVTIFDIVTGAGEFGSVVEVRQMLSQFWKSGASDAVGWPMDYTLLTQDKLRNQLDAITQNCMGLNVRKLPSGKYGFFVTAPMDLQGDTVNAYISGASGPRTLGAPERAVICGKQLLKEDSGIALEFGLSGFNEIVNDIEIKYGPDLMSTATCDETASKDGVGNAWGYQGYAPFTGGLTAVELCVWSQAQYGKQDKLRLSLPEVSSPQVAVQIGLHCLLFGYRQSISWRATGNAGLLDVWPGHVIRFDNDLLERANFRFPLDDSAAGLWSDKSCLVTRSEHQRDGGVRQVLSGIVLPKWFRLEKTSDGDADTTPWVPPETPPPAYTPITVGGPGENLFDRDDETFPNPNE